MVIPPGVFGDLPPQVRCSGSAVAVGAPLIVNDDAVARVRSIAELRDRAGTLVGWVYLADRDDRIYAQANETMKDPDLRALQLRRAQVPGPSSIAPLAAAPLSLRVVPCTLVEQKIVD